ncbi:Flp family type IVb pilin [Nocardioides maradonensis]
MPNTRGASSVEYGLLASLIAGVIISVVLVLGPKVADLFVLAWP